MSFDEPMDELAPLRAFSLTHVQYKHGDHVGFLMALISLSPIFAMVSYATLGIVRRDLATASLCFGQLLNEVINYALKHTIKEPRPVILGAAHAAALHAGAPKYGMPSDHSQFMAFLATYLAVWALRSWKAPAHERYFVILASQLAAAAVAASRVYLGYHSVLQVLAGYGVGCVTGVVWYAVTQACLRPLFPALANSALGRTLRMRDSTRVDDVLGLEYRAIAAASAAAAAEAGSPHQIPDYKSR